MESNEERKKEEEKAKEEKEAKLKTTRKAEVNAAKFNAKRKLEEESSKKQILTPSAVDKHLYPDCKGAEDAEEFSRARNKKWKTDVNTVLVVEEQDFHQEGKYVVSNERVPFYQCRMKENGHFQVRFLMNTFS